MKNAKRSKIILFGVLGLLVLTCAAFFVIRDSFGGMSKEPAKANSSPSDMQPYITIAQNVTVENRRIDDELFRDSSAALETFVASFNENSPTIKLDYLRGNSFATGGEDKYGSRYYITAKKDVTATSRSTFTFYITSAGENRQFDTQTLIPDADDITGTLLAGTCRGVGVTSEGIAETPQPDAEDFGISDIIAAKPEETDNPNPGIEEGTLPSRVTLTFNAQGGTGGPSTIRVKNGVHLKSYSFTIPTKANYQFLGYFSEDNGSGIQYFNSNGIGMRYAEFEENTTLFAAWSGKSVIVNFDNDGGTGSTSVTAYYGSALPKVSVPTKAGYAFLGYYESDGKSGKQIYSASGNPMVTNEYTQNVTLTASWVAQSFTVEHYLMDVSGSYPDSPYKTDVVANNQTKTKISAFADSSVLISNGIVIDKAQLNGSDVQQVEITSDESVLKMYYKRCAYSVTAVAGNGVTSVSGAGSYRYGQKVIVNATLDAGYTWSHWYNIQTSSISSSSQKYSFTMATSSVSLEAQAYAADYTITLNANGGYCSTSSIGVEYGEQYYYRLPTASRAGYRFLGWSKAKTSSSVIPESETFKTTNGMTLYAQWEAGEYEITLDMQGGQGGVTSVYVEYGGSMPQIQALPTREGYDFAGYFDQKNGQGLCYYSANGSSRLTSDFDTDDTLYAYWTAKSKNIVYYDKGGEAFSGVHAFDYAQTAKYGEKTALKSATKEGCTFDGWFTDQACTAAVTEVRPEDFSADTIKLFAKWTPA